MKFIVDAQLPVALAEWIVAQGHQAHHLAELGLLSASDQTIWDAAVGMGAAILTKDHDFVEWATTRKPAPPIVWVRIGNADNATLIERLEAAWDKVLRNLEAGAIVVETGGS